MFGQQNRLTKKKDFDNVFKNGKGTFEQFFGIKTLPNELKTNRYGILVSNKVNKSAVGRNLIKRRVRAILRLLHPEIKQGFDIIIITQPKIREAEYKEIEMVLIKIFKKIKFLVTPKIE